MPKWLHDKLAKSAKKSGLTGKNAAAYIYGTMNKIEEQGGMKAHKKRKGKGVAKP